MQKIPKPALENLGNNSTAAGMDGGPGPSEGAESSRPDSPVGEEEDAVMTYFNTVQDIKQHNLTTRQASVDQPPSPGILRVFA